MNFTEDEIIDALISDKLNEMVKNGKIKAIVLEEGTVSLVYNDDRSVVVTNKIKVEAK